MKYLVLLVVSLVFASAAIFEDHQIILSKKIDNLPWPILNVHSLDFLTTHGLHCYYKSLETMNKQEMKPMDKMHLTHCLDEITGVLKYLNDNPSFSLPTHMCEKITGVGKDWLYESGEYYLNYLDNDFSKITVSDYLIKDEDYKTVYTKIKNMGNIKQDDKIKTLYVDYGHSMPKKTLYVDYSHSLPRSNVSSSIFKSENLQFISQQDNEMRIIAGFNYGLILLKDMLKMELNPSEKEYVLNNIKTQSEWSWMSASFYCSFKDKTKDTLGDFQDKVQKYLV